MKLFIFGLSFVFCISSAFAQHHPVEEDSESKVMIEILSGSDIKSNAINFEFKLMNHTSTGMSYLSDSDLVVMHEKKLHFLVYDQSLNEFQHVHPQFDGQKWTVGLNFKASGNYWMWAQGKTVAGEEFSVSNKITVAVNGPGWPLPATLTENRTGRDGVSTVTLESTKVKASKMAMLSLVISRNDGTQPSVTPYLGAFAHVVAVFSDANSLVHVHPQDTASPNEGLLHVTFPSKGMYRLWVQFNDGSTLKTVPLAIEVF